MPQQAVEPHPGLYPNAGARYLAATRPAFLTASLAPGLIGLATAFHDRALAHPELVLPVLLGPVLAGAGANVVNDYYDHLNGTDQGNQERVFPFTGGSRMIQNQVLTPGETLGLGGGLLLTATAMGALIAPVTGVELLWFVLAGLFIAWAYSAPPLRLNSRGLGELCIALAFGILLPAGADFAQRGAFSPLPVVAGFPYAMLVTNLLYINQFPDRKADAVAGKCHWVVRLGSAWARWVYLLLTLLGHGELVLALALGWLPATAGLALLSLPVSLVAARGLLRHHDAPEQLRQPIQLTIVAMLLQGVAMALGLAVG